MEKQTKILLGVGAVIAAYLILKPKKAMAQTTLVSLKKPPTPNDGSSNEYDYIPKRPYMPRAIESTEEELNAYYQRRMEEEQNCLCAKAPCNCGDGGVKLDVLIPTQSSEY